MMKFIAILLVFVSSSKLTYHKAEDEQNLCSLVVFDDSECPELKAELVKQQFIAGSCPNTRETNCDVSQDQAAKILQLGWKFALSAFCGFNQDHVEFHYKCVQPDGDEPVQARNMETYHVENAGQPCAYVEFDVNKCADMKEALSNGTKLGEKFSSGPCPSTYTKSSCENEDTAPKADEVANRKLALGQLCTLVDDFTYDLACEPRMKTFHKIDASNGLCTYVDFDRFECNDLPNFLENDQGYLPGPCPNTHDRSYCDSTTGTEMDSVAALGTLTMSVFCNLDVDDVTYGFACEEGRGAIKCPEACANAIAADKSTAADEANGIEATGFCSTIMTELEKDVFPDACSDLGETTLGLCMTELYEKCVIGHEELICPIPQYGLPPVLKDCEPKTCGEWKAAVDTGCAKQASACLKDELQGNLGCTINGKDLKVSSSDACGKTKACTKNGEFCSYDENMEGKCELCSLSLCALLTNEKAKAECLKACGEDDCTTGPGCDYSCERTAKTCTQLKNVMESPNGCGRTCNQCYIDVHNARLGCEGKYKVQSRIDGDSASALSILMLASIAIFLWI